MFQISAHALKIKMAKNDDDYLKRKHRTKSSVWTHFSIKHPVKYELTMKAKKKAKGKGKATGTSPRSGI